jgi:hypothetical protein
MGADLYMNSVFLPNRDKYNPKFTFWIAARDKLQEKEKKKDAQEKVNFYFEKMYELGYLRDSYNETNLLWLFGLSWWKDVLNVLTDKEGCMQPDQAKNFLQLLKFKEAVFKGNLKNGQADYFIKKYGRLKSLLRQAIQKKEAIFCSL